MKDPDIPRIYLLSCRIYKALQEMSGRAMKPSITCVGIFIRSEGTGFFFN